PEPVEAGAASEPEPVEPAPAVEPQAEPELAVPVEVPPAVEPQAEPEPVLAEPEPVLAEPEPVLAEPEPALPVEAVRKPVASDARRPAPARSQAAVRLIALAIIGVIAAAASGFALAPSSTSSRSAGT